MTCRELAEHLLKTPDAKVEAVIPDGAFEAAVDSFEVLYALDEVGGVVLLGGNEIEVEDDE